MNPNIMKKAVLITLAIIILAGIAFYFFRPHAPLPKKLVIDTSHQPTQGNEKAKIEIVAFEDLKCANCMRFNTTIYPKIKKELIDTGKAKYTMINLAFIPGSMPAANAARCIYTQNSKAFFEFVDYLFEHQPPENEDWATIPNLMQMAQHIHGLDKKQLSECLVKNPHNDFISNNMSIAEKAMGGNVATPAIFVNGIAVQPLTYDRIQEVIDTIQ